MFTTMTALVDCNSFYASCERVFAPQLASKPVMVLSNNDGCVIARTDEVKALGIPMGVPFFQVKELVKKHNIQVFSSNYALYGDMSRRVMKTFELFTPEVEVYSIDEAFLHFEGFEHWNLEAHGKEIRQTVLQYTGIPTSVGVAPTKVLAKIANHLAKKKDVYQGVCVLDTEEKIDQALQDFPIEDVWGIGRKLSRTLLGMGVQTAKQYRDLPENFVRQKFTVQGHRLIKELKGISCYALQESIRAKKQIISTRSFGHRVYALSDLQEAIANHVSNACLKLRKQNSSCQYLYVFIRTGKHEKQRSYYGSDMVTLNTATFSTNKLIKQANLLAQKMYRKGYPYKKCGVHLLGIVPNNQVQRSLFTPEDSHKDQKLMMVMDQINQKQGKSTVRFAACGGHNINWSMKSDQRSPCYTTRWDELLEVS